MRTIRLLHDDRSGPAADDTALSHAILKEVARGASPETVRIYRPSRVVAFGRHDTVSPTYPDAVRAARRAGYEPIERLAGGRAAVFHPDTIAFSWAIPEPDPKQRITGRFEMISAIVRDACRDLGVDARIGEIDGEYCPGAYSVNANGTHKLMGVGQRLVRGAAHVGGVLVAGDSEGTRAILEDVYAALRLPWRPETVGAVDSFVPATWHDVAGAVISRFGDRHSMTSGVSTGEERALAASLAEQHLVSVG